MILVAIICSGLIGSSSLAIARAATSQVISGDTENFRKYQGFAPGGQTHKVQGTGYFDKQWGTVELNQAYDGWFWSTGHYGNYTIDTLVWAGSAEYNHQQTQDIYLARGNGPSKVLVESMHDVNVYPSGKNITAPGGQHTYPEVLTFQWKKGANSATLTLTDPQVLVSKAGTINTNATMYGYPQYLRLGGNGTLNVQWDGTNETASAPAIREDFHTH